MPDAVRAPDELLEGLPDFPFESQYREFDGLRLAHLDEGDGPPVVFFHGEPTWSFLWRKVIGPVRDAGYRCIAPDLAGFGRSDKPTDLGWYSYDQHAAAVAPLLEELDLRDATVVVHDWGGPIGLRLAVEHPDRIARMVVLDTGPTPGERSGTSWSGPRTCRSASSYAEPASATPAMRSSPPTTRRSRTSRQRPARARSR
jgi:haloalkane dehalogenase